MAVTIEQPTNDPTFEARLKQELQQKIVHTEAAIKQNQKQIKDLERLSKEFAAEIKIIKNALKQLG